VERHRANGLRVTFEREGTAIEPGTAVDRAAYRIVQEALTNAARHGDGAAHVLLRFGEEQLEIAVTNPMHPGAQPPQNGRHGLVGMRERAALLGGALVAGPDGDAFRVRAVLPYGGTRG
jgi:signal transduction histidine kinase